MTTIDGVSVDPINLDPTGDPAVLRAVFRPAGGALSIDQAAKLLHVNHFNWIQHLTLPSTSVRTVTVSPLQVLPIDGGLAPENDFSQSVVSPTTYVPPIGAVVSPQLSNTILDPILVAPSSPAFYSFYLVNTHIPDGKGHDIEVPIVYDGTNPPDGYDFYFDEPGLDARFFSPDAIVFRDRPTIGFGVGGPLTSFETQLVGVSNAGNDVPLIGTKIKIRWTSNAAAANGTFEKNSATDSPLVASGGIRGVAFDDQPFNHPPLISSIQPKTIARGSTLSTTATASDPDFGQTLTFSLDSPPAGASIDPRHGSLYLDTDRGRNRRSSFDCRSRHR